MKGNFITSSLEKMKPRKDIIVRIQKILDVGFSWNRSYITAREIAVYLSIELDEIERCLNYMVVKKMTIPGHVPYRSRGGNTDYSLAYALPYRQCEYAGKKPKLCPRCGQPYRGRHAKSTGARRHDKEKCDHGLVQRVLEG